MHERPTRIAAKLIASFLFRGFENRGMKVLYLEHVNTSVPLMKRSTCGSFSTQYSTGILAKTIPVRAPPASWA